MTQTTPDRNLFPTDPTDGRAIPVADPREDDENGAANGPVNGPVAADPQKRGSLIGGALTEEALASSRRVLQRSRGNKNATS